MNAMPTSDANHRLNYIAGRGLLLLAAVATPAGLWGQAPAAPSGLTAGAGDMQIPLSWNAVSGATSYNVFQGTASGAENATPIATLITATSYIATGLTDGTRYFFTVAAVNSSGSGAFSNEASATPAVQPVGTNSAASFSIFPPVQAANPVPAGFNMQPAAGTNITENVWLADGGFSPLDARFSFTALSGTATTFVVTYPNPGADFYQSIVTGYFVGATALTYRYSNGAWSLLRTDTVSAYTADGEDETAANNTITFASSGPAVQQGDIIWLELDDQAVVPGVTLLDPRFTVYCANWSTETLGCDTRTATLPYTLSTDVPASDAGGLSLEITDTNAETNGIWQYMQYAFVGPSYEQFQPGHTYEVDVWLKQSGIGSGSVTFSISGIGVSHAFTGVTSTWQHFTWTFPAVPGLPANSVQPSAHLDFSAPGTLWVDNLQLYDAAWPPNSVSPQALQAWESYHPGTVRIWSNFGNAAENYSYFSLDSWLTPEIKTRNTPGIGNEYELPGELEHLPDALANVKTIGANPWMIINMALSPTEWSELIDYLSAPAGTGYASKRPASHPGPYTADFSTIYLEVGNEEWGTQQVPADAAYGQWAHFVLSQAIAGKSYFNPSQIRFIADGFDLIPSFGSNAAAAAPEISVVDAALYTQGNTTLAGDAYFQSDLVQVPVSNGPIINAIAAQQKADAGIGLNYSLAAYEEGPGADTPTHTGDTTLAAGIGAVDVNLYAALNGFGPQNLFEYGLGTGPYTSHTNFANGFRPHPVWEALQMRNNYCTGPMVLTVANNVPTYTDPVITNGQAVPLIAVYTFADANVVNQADVVVISRDLNNQTPVTLNFPATPTGTAQLYTLTGDPRQTNDSAMNIPIGSQSLTGVTKSYTFTMPPGSMYIFQVPLSGTWSGAGEPVPPAPTFLTATGGNGQAGLNWTASPGATSYNVYQGTASGGESVTPIVTGVTSATYTVTGLTNEHAYFFKVTALDAGGMSGSSNEATATPLLPGSGTILAYEPFSEADGALSGVSGGGDFGWGSAWQEQGNSTAVPGYNIASATPLTYTGLLTSGNYSIGGYEYQGAGRLLNQDPNGPFSSYLSGGLISAPGSTVWVSFLLRKDTNSTDTNAVYLNPSGVGWWAGSPNSIAAGYFGATSNDAHGNPFWSLQYNNGTPVLTNVPVVVGQSVLFVLEVNFAATSGAANIVNLYLNPTSLSETAPSTANATISTTSSVGFDAIAVYGGAATNEMSLDEIRVGTSFASVTPVFGKISQTITFPYVALTSYQYALTTVALKATASSGLPVTYISQTPTVCTVSESGTGVWSVALLTSGSCSLGAEQTGNSIYAAAPFVGQTFWVYRAPQTITFPYVALTSYQYVLTTVTLKATASSGLPVTYISQTPSVCTVSESGTGVWSASLLASGNCSLGAEQAGNSIYATAPFVGQTFWVYRALQSITFPAIASQTVGATVTLGATASSGLTVSYASITASVCTVGDSTALLLAVGTCTIQATQAGNATYSAAAPVTRSFTITAAATKSAKRGIAYDLADPADFAALSPGVSWWYNWSPTPNSSVPSNYASSYQMIFYPMLWNGNFNSSSVTAYLQANPSIQYMLVMNEPNCTDQADLTSAQAAAVWPQYEAVAAQTMVHGALES